MSPVERVFCSWCRRMLDPADFPAGNRSTCKACKNERDRARRAADPDRERAARRQRDARQALRVELAEWVLTRVLELVPGDARAELLDALADQIRDLEDRHGVEPGEGLRVLTRRDGRARVKV